MRGYRPGRPVQNVDLLLWILVVLQNRQQPRTRTVELQGAHASGLRQTSEKSAGGAVGYFDEVIALTAAWLRAGKRHRESATLRPQCVLVWFVTVDRDSSDIFA